MILAILGGFIGAALVPTVFAAGVLFERRRARQKPEAAAPKTAPDPQAERRHREWEDWMRFLHYDGTPQGAEHEG